LLLRGHNIYRRKFSERFDFLSEPLEFFKLGSNYSCLGLEAELIYVQLRVLTRGD